jgi:hypothetical protein
MRFVFGQWNNAFLALLPWALESIAEEYAAWADEVLVDGEVLHVRPNAHMDNDGWRVDVSILSVHDPHNPGLI